MLPDHLVINHMLRSRVSCSYDVNVTPNKRKVLFQDERELLTALQEVKRLHFETPTKLSQASFENALTLQALTEIWEPTRSRYKVQGTPQLGQKPSGSQVSCKNFLLISLSAPLSNPCIFMQAATQRHAREADEETEDDSDSEATEATPQGDPHQTPDPLSSIPRQAAPQNRACEMLHPESTRGTRHCTVQTPRSPQFPQHAWQGIPGKPTWGGNQSILHCWDASARLQREVQPATHLPVCQSIPPGSRSAALLAMLEAQELSLAALLKLHSAILS